MNGKRKVPGARVTRQAIAAGAIALLVVVVAYGGWRVYDDARQRPYRQLEANLAEIHNAIVRFHMDFSEGYPPSLTELFTVGYLEKPPENPFRPSEPMPMLSVGEAAVPGAVMYLP